MSQSSLYHVFATQAGALAAAAAIYAKMVLLKQAIKVQKGGAKSLLDLSTMQQVDVTTLPAAALTGARFPFYGIRGNDPSGQDVLDPKTWTTAWDIPRQIPFGANAGKWIIAVPTLAAIKLAQAETADDPTWWEAVPSPVDPNA